MIEPDILGATTAAPSADPAAPATPITDKWRELKKTNPIRAAQFLLVNEKAFHAEADAVVVARLPPPAVVGPLETELRRLQNSDSAMEQYHARLFIKANRRQLNEERRANGRQGTF